MNHPDLNDYNDNLDPSISDDIPTELVDNELKLFDCNWCQRSFTSYEDYLNHEGQCTG